MNIWFIMLIPILSSFIGWITNFLAIQMLFRPLKPLSFLGIKFWGLIPKRHVQIAQKVSMQIAQEFFTEKDLLGLIESPDIAHLIRQYIMLKWDEKIEEVLDSVPMIKMFVQPKSLNGLRDKAAELFSKDPQMLVNQVQKIIQGKLNVQQIIEKNILEFDLLKLEEMVKVIAQYEIVMIKRIGAVLGFMIGMIQLIILLLLK